MPYETSPLYKTPGERSCICTIRSPRGLTTSDATSGLMPLDLACEIAVAAAMAFGSSSLSFPRITLGEQGESAFR